MEQGWYYAEGEGSVGPVSFDALTSALRRSTDPANTLVWRPGFQDWRAAHDVPELAARLFALAPTVVMPQTLSPARGSLVLAGQTPTVTIAAGSPGGGAPSGSAFQLLPGRPLGSGAHQPPRIVAGLPGAPAGIVRSPKPEG